MATRRLAATAAVPLPIKSTTAAAALETGKNVANPRPRDVAMVEGAIDILPTEAPPRGEHGKREGNDFPRDSKGGSEKRRYEERNRLVKAGQDAEREKTKRIGIDDHRSQSSSGASASGGGVDEKSANEKLLAAGRKRRRQRRGPRRRYKPYHKLSYEEKLERDRWEQRRAERNRIKGMELGRAMAPYNTTQFLLEDRKARNLEPDTPEGGDMLTDPLTGAVGGLRTISRERTYSGTGSMDSEGTYGSWADGASGLGGPDEGSESLSFEREFEAEYESVHAERLEAMSKDSLVQDYVKLENNLQRSQVECKELRDQVQRLRQENYQLRKQMAESGLLPRPSSAPPIAHDEPPSLDIGESRPQIGNGTNNRPSAAANARIGTQQQKDVVPVQTQPSEQLPNGVDGTAPVASGSGRHVIDETTSRGNSNLDSGANLNSCPLDSVEDLVELPTSTTTNSLEDNAASGSGISMSGVSSSRGREFDYGSRLDTHRDSIELPIQLQPTPTSVQQQPIVSGSSDRVLRSRRRTANGRISSTDDTEFEPNDPVSSTHSSGT